MSYPLKFITATNGGSAPAGGGSGPATVTYDDGTTAVVTVRNWFPDAVPAGKKMIIGWVEGQWHAVSWDC